MVSHHPADTGRKLNVHKTFRRRPGRLLNDLCTFNLRPVSAGHPAMFGGQRRCDSGDTMFLVAEEEKFRCSHFNLLLLFISKGLSLKAHDISC